VSEISFLFVVHRDQFVSKWQTALAPYFGSSLKEGLPTPFAHLYVYYNAISRQDIGRKTRIYNEAIAERLSKLWFAFTDRTRRNFWFRVRRKLIYFIVGSEMKFLSTCNPVTVLRVSESQDVKFVAFLNQLENDLQQHEKSNSKSLKCWSYLCDCYRRICRQHKVAPFHEGNVKSQADDSALHHMRTPQELVSKICNLRKFLKETFSRSTRRSLLCLLLFDRSNDFGTSAESQKYYLRLMHRSESAKKCIQALFLLGEELLQKSVSFERELTFFERLSNFLVGRRSKILTTFRHTGADDLLAAFSKYKFEQLDATDICISSLEELLAHGASSDRCKSQESGDSSSQQLLKENPGSEGLESNSALRAAESSLLSKPQKSSLNRPDVMIPEHFECPGTADAFEYRGDFNDSFYNGNGTVLFRNGDRYDGHICNGKRDGAGEFVWASGAQYNGQWSNDRFHGLGILKCKQYMFEGFWKEGHRTGQGKIVFDRGDMYDGNWEQDSYCGDGVYSFSDGRTLRGVWAHGNLVKETALSSENEASSAVPQLVEADGPSVRQSLSFYQMMFPSQVDINGQQGPAKELSNNTQLMQWLEDTKQYCNDIEVAEKKRQDMESMICTLKQQRQTLLDEQSHLSSQISRVVEKIQERQVQQQVQDIDHKVKVLKAKRDAMVSEHNLRIIDVLRSKISLLQNAKKELEEKLTVKRIRDYQSLQNKPKVQSQQDEAVAALRMKIPAQQYELNQAQVELAELSMANMHLKSKLESLLQQNSSLRAQLGLGPLKNSD
jgi:hypothetical protein